MGKSDHPDQVLLTFGLTVRRQRESRNWSLDVLADKSGVSRTMLIGIEHGRRNPSLKVIVMIAEALGTTPSALLAGLDGS